MDTTSTLKLLGYASLRVLNQEVLAPGASFQPRTYPKVDILNLILEGEAEYRDSDGNHVQAKAGEALLISTQPGVSYSEHNLSKRLFAHADAAVAGCLPGARKTRWYRR
nr:Pirin-like protein YhaK [Raoultella sp. NCTC 9187]